MPILAVVRLLQSSSEIFCGVFAKFLFEHGWIGKFSSIGTRQRGLEGLMLPERIEEREKARLIGGDEKADQSLRFIVKRRHSICRRKSYCRKRRQRDQVLHGDGFRMRLGNVTTRALITGVGGFGNILGESFIQPAWDAVGVKPVDDQVHDLVPEQVAGKFVFWVALNEEASLRLNSAGPGFQFAEGLKLLPLFRTFENINVRFDVAWRLVALQLFGDDAGGRLALARVLYAQGKYDDFAKEARAAAAFLANWKAPVPEVRDFLAKFDRWGPGAGLPPAPDPRTIIGWNYD